MNAKDVKRLLQTNSFLGDVYHDWQMRLAAWRGRDPIVVYQMGKVGSSSIIASLRACRLGRPILHIHTLSEAGLEHGRNLYGWVDWANPRSRHLMVSRLLRRHLAEDPGRHYKVITLVREPVARNISSMFQIIDLLVPNFLAHYHAGTIDLAGLTQLFLQEFPSDRQMTNEWFDRELKCYFEVDVFAGEFPVDQGYWVYRGERADVLLIKLEKLDECAGTAFKEFLGLESFSLVKTNAAEDKTYYPAYREFVDRVILPPSYLDTIYAAPLARHFYSEAELAVFKARWMRS